MGSWRRRHRAAAETRLRIGRGPAGLASAVSHDFAQPLATVTSLANLLATDWDEFGEADRRDLAARIDAGAGVLAARYRHVVVVLDLLSGRVTPGGVTPVRSALDAAVAALPTGHRVGVSGPPLRAVIDRDHLEHVIATLVADAMAAGAPPIRVRVVPDGRYVRIDVSDHSRTPARLSHASARSPVTGAWTVLPRCSPPSRTLGLAMAARLVAQDGGTLWHQPGHGRRGERVAIRLSRAPDDPPS